MTEQEAIKILKIKRGAAVAVLDSGFGTNDGENNIVYRTRKELCDICISALEKQLPKKATHPYEHCANPQCPVCGDWEWSTYKSQWKPNYCPNCGQALDWSD